MNRLGKVRARVLTTIAAVVMALLATLAIADPASAAPTGGGCRAWSAPDTFGIQMRPCLIYNNTETLFGNHWYLDTTFQLDVIGTTPGGASEGPTWVCVLRLSVNGGGWHDVQSIPCSAGVTERISPALDIIVGARARWYVSVGYIYHSTRYDEVETPVLYGP